MVERGPGPAMDGEPGGVYNVANMITMLRLLMTPVFLTVLIMGEGRYDVVAFVLFAVASATDFLDGQIARRTGTVTALGKALDPLVDRLLIAFGVLGLYLLGRLPLWVLAVLVLRDIWLLYGAWVLERHDHRRIPVTFAGKATTFVLLTAFSALMLGDAFNIAGVTPLELGTVLMYGGVVLSVTTALQYTVQARRVLAQAKRGVREERGS